MTGVYSPDGSVLTYFTHDGTAHRMLLPPGATIRLPDVDRNFHIPRGEERAIGPCVGEFEVVSWDTTPPTLGDRFRSWVHAHVCQRGAR